jgi:hypothetical protein
MNFRHQPRGEHEMTHPPTRREFIAACGAVLATLAAPAQAMAAHPRGRGHGDPHPTPRAGITGARVTTHDQLADKPQLVELFDGVRAIPEVVDGIRCNCGCSHTEGFYSLLTCYEGKAAMARDCPVCQGQGRLTVRLHKAGKSLEEIRAAVDAKFG